MANELGMKFGIINSKVRVCSCNVGDKEGHKLDLLITSQVCVCGDCMDCSSMTLRGCRSTIRRIPGSKLHGNIAKGISHIGNSSLTSEFGLMYECTSMQGLEPEMQHVCKDLRQVM